MEPIAHETWKSFQRSYYRQRLLLLLASLGEAYVGQLGRALRLPHSRVIALLHGAPPGYAVELALVPLGLAQEKPTARGRAYEITTKGRRKARSVTAAKARRARARPASPVQVAAPESGLRWGVQGWTAADDRSSVTWSVDG